ncbi:MAG TPA: glutamate racemase [Terriglobales bacterium]|nr:glutamate racemase [Terriglobales bacterium]
MKLGVFDSGVGGLTVLRAMVNLVPQADYLYFGDTARLPYGSKSVETVRKYAVSAAHYLEQHGAEMLVIACNTATALALDAIQSAVKVPVVGVIEPGADAAVAATRKKNVLVVGTEATIGSHAYKHALEKRGMRVYEKACPLFVPLIEEGWAEHDITQRVAHVYLDEFFQDHEKGPDLLVLGCTHYPLIKRMLRAVAPWRVEIVDSAEATAAVVAKQLESSGSSRLAPRSSELKFFATDSVEKFRRLGERFMGRPIANVEHVEMEH